jgi:hypothetical protein
LRLCNVVTIHDTELRSHGANLREAGFVNRGPDHQREHRAPVSSRVDSKRKAFIMEFIMRVKSSTQSWENGF